MIATAAGLVQLLGLVLIAYNLQLIFNRPQLPASESECPQEKRRIAWVDGPGNQPLSTYMLHIKEAFQHRGYKVITGPQDENVEWDVMWIHDYSLTKPEYSNHIVKSNPFQTVNHIPGSGYYSSKVALATCKSCIGVPEAFKLPDQKEQFLKFAESNKDFLWVQKDNAHRNIRIRPIDELDLNKGNSFIQRFVSNPLLIDNRKFDIGVYTVITSLQPLKAYVYNGDALLRFCAQDYHPFDENDVDKYVVGDDYTPIWEIESLSPYYNQQGLGRRASLDAWLRKQGKDPMRVWGQIGDIIAQVFQNQQAKMLAAAKSTPFAAQHFELSRFDFIVDDDLNVFLMEANMSPNLSSGHFKQNQVLYEQVLHSVFSLVGLSSPFTPAVAKSIRNRPENRNFLATEKDLAIDLKECHTEACLTCQDSNLVCQLCGHCISNETTQMLRSAYIEHTNRAQMIRVQFDYEKMKPLTKQDRLLDIWIKAKCQEDYTWC